MLYRWDENNIKYNPTYVIPPEEDKVVLYDRVAKSSLYYAHASNFSVQGDKFALQSDKTKYVSGERDGHGNPSEFSSSYYFILDFNFNRNSPTLGSTMYFLPASLGSESEIRGDKYPGASSYKYDIITQYPHKIRVYSLSPGPGELNQYVYSTDSSAYPTNGKQGGYWYNFNYINKGD